jgi:hypothetical protein
MLQYTEILVNFQSPILDADDNPLIETDYILEILFPRSNRPGVYQSVPDKVTVTATVGQDLRLKLLPSDRYFPLGRYQVNYYKPGNPEPIEHQQWLVPERKGMRNFVWQVSSLSEAIPLPDDYFSHLDPAWDGTFEILSNQLNWITNNPPVGTEISIGYLAAVTLDQLIEIPERNSGLAHFQY